MKKGIVQTYHKLEGEERPGVPSQVRHEVDDRVVHEDTRDGERHVGYGVGDDDSGGPIESVTEL